jgi:hypothetical protein
VLLHLASCMETLAWFVNVIVRERILVVRLMTRQRSR